MIYFLLSPERLETSVSTMRLEEFVSDDSFPRLLLDDDVTTYPVSGGGGLHKRYYIEFIKRIAARFAQPSSLEWSTSFYYVFQDVYPLFLKFMLIDFTTQHYDDWRLTVINSPFYMRIDNDVHVDFCASCVLVDCCVFDCDKLCRARRRRFAECMDAHVSSLEMLFNRFWVDRCGQRLPELQHEYELLGS